MLRAGISFGTTLFVERRREKTAAALAREQVAQDLRRASRRRWWSVPPRALPTEAWRDHRSTLAAHLDNATWETVALGYSSVQELNLFLDSIRAETASLEIHADTTRLDIHHGSVARALTELRVITQGPVEGAPFRPRP